MKVSGPILCTNEFIRCKGKGSIFWEYIKILKFVRLKKKREGEEENNTHKGFHTTQ